MRQPGLWLVAFGIAFSAATSADAADRSPKDLWDDFAHYVMIARPKLAADAADRLVTDVEKAKLLSVVESSDRRDDLNRLFSRAEKMEGLSETAKKLARKVQAARIDRSREPERIRADIEKLTQGPRAYRNALERLRAAGQYAAPHLLATLRDDDKASLHPYVQAAMVAIGRPMVYPLAVALPELGPVKAGQVAQTLAEIGYPRALPYLKQAMGREQLRGRAQRRVERAFRQLSDASKTSPESSVAELFLALGRNLYEAKTADREIAGYDEAIEKGIVWEFERRAGLIAIQVPQAIYGDVLAMRAAQRALEASPNLNPALSLWLAANLRRENDLPEGTRDPSYQHPRKAIFYAKAAGPLRQHDVLKRALRDEDQALALDAIEALNDTAGTDALVRQVGTAQPLIDALSHPDRRIRFRAAFALARARPDEPFTSSFRVVPVLAEAARQTKQRVALVIAPSQERINELKAMLRDLGYQAFGGESLGGVADAISEGPGMDLIVAAGEAERIASVYAGSSDHYKLAAVPMLAFSSGGDRAELARRFPDERRLVLSGASLGSGKAKQAVEKTTARYENPDFGAESALTFAETALKLLHQIALASPEVFNVKDAERALIGALDDDRPKVVRGAARVLALIDSARAQRALARSALDSERETGIRVSLLRDLSGSATHFGARLTDTQLDQVLELVQNSEGELAVAAARAHGALTLPTSNVVDMIGASEDNPKGE